MRYKTPIVLMAGLGAAAISLKAVAAAALQVLRVLLLLTILLPASRLVAGRTPPDS